MEPWLTEWVRFNESSIEDMKKHADGTHTHREWMTYVYEQGHGILEGTGNGRGAKLAEDKSGKTLIFDTPEEAKEYAQQNGITGTESPIYQMGSPSYGSESRIEINPASKAAQDFAFRGLHKRNRRWTIHGHPLKDGKIYTGRQYFSSTDLLQEFIRARDNDEYIVQYLVYPHQQIDTTTGEKVIHNRVRTVIFPGREKTVAAMKAAGLKIDPMAITVQNGQNRSEPDGNGGTTLVNDAGVDWFDFQEELGKKGYMGIVDIEGPSGGRKFRSESMGLVNFTGIGAIAVTVLLLYWANKHIGVSSAAESIEVIDSYDVEGGRHWWQN